MGFLLQFLATKAIAPILGSIVLLTMGEHPVSLSNVDFYIGEETLYFSTKLENAFPKELVEIIKSDIPVTFRLHIEADETIHIVHIVHYDIETMIYTIGREETNDTLKTDNEKEMKSIVSRFSDIPVPIEKIPSSGKMIIRVSLDVVTLDFLDDEKFDLMTLWDYRSPQQTIEIKKLNPKS